MTEKIARQIVLAARPHDARSEEILVLRKRRSRRQAPGRWIWRRRSSHTLRGRSPSTLPRACFCREANRQSTEGLSGTVRKQAATKASRESKCL